MLTDTEIVNFYLQSEKTKKECIKSLGCTRWRFDTALKNLNCTKINHYKLPDCESIKQMYESGQRVVEIANKFKVSHTSVSEALSKAGYSFISKDSRTICTSLTEKQKQIIEGEILGDGCIAKQKGRVNPVFRHGTITKEYIEYLKTSLPFLSDIEIVTKKAHSYIDKNGKIWNSKESYLITSRSDRSLKPFYESWYINNKKDVPIDFQLTKISCLHWYLGDGSCTKNVITLCTDSFSEQGVNILSAQLQLNGIENIIFSTKRLNSNGGASLRIRVKRSQSQNFFNFIGDSPIQSLNYKWGLH